MKPRAGKFGGEEGRAVRKALKWGRWGGRWGGAAATVLLVVVWVGSAWWRAEWTRSSGQLKVTAGSGAVAVTCFAGAGQPGTDGFQIKPTFGNPSLRLAFMYIDYGWGAWYVQVPIWMAVAPPLTLTAALWRLDSRARRRVRVGCCVTCGYDRRGIAAGAVCPECGVEGAAPKAAAATESSQQPTS